jgi:hypothetical protein
MGEVRCLDKEQMLLFIKEKIQTFVKSDIDYD